MSEREDGKVRRAIKPEARRPAPALAVARIEEQAASYASTSVPRRDWRASHRRFIQKGAERNRSYGPSRSCREPERETGEAVN